VIVPAGAALAALVALAAASGALRVPPWPLSPDGDDVAAATTPTATGATVTPVAPGRWRVLPAPGAREVTLEASGVRRTLPVEPPPGAVEIALDPPAPVKGRDDGAAVVLTVRDAAGAPDAAAPAPVVTASTGRLVDLAPDGPGRWRGRWVPAASRHPEVLHLVALVPRCPRCATPRAAGVRTVAIAARIALPGRAEPGVQARVEVGGRAFGPVVADAKGRFTLDLEVPPGAQHAVAVSADALGNRKRTSIDLGLPPADLLACLISPPIVPADGVAEASLWCAAGDGAPAPATARAERGMVSALAPAGAGLWTARYRAPRGGAARGDAIEVVAGALRERVPVALATGAPEAIEVRVARAPVPLGATVPADAWARDARGDRLGAARPAPGERGAFEVAGAFTAPASSPDWTSRARLAFALARSGDAAEVTLRREGSDWVAEARAVDGRPAEGVALAFGSGAHATTDARGAAHVAARGDEETVVAAGGARGCGWAGVGSPAAPTAIERTVEVALRPPSPVDVVASAEGGVVSWRVEDAAGTVLPGRRVALRASGVELGPVQADGPGGRAAVRRGAGTVAVVDVETGVAAVLEVR
jgi:hypothetical protein